MTERKPSLESAYAVEGQDQVRALYRDWATTYDETFIAQMSYVMPQVIASIFLRERCADGPILDVGCGSGAVGLALAGRRIDGLDLSPEMLEVATGKGVYTRLIEGDLLARLPLNDDIYQGVVSAGTFTHGHVGPAALSELIRVAAPGALFVLGINAEHFASHGFDAAFKALTQSGAIRDLQFEDHPIYDAKHERAADRALVAIFRVARKSG